MLAHKAVYEGHVAAEVIAGKKHYFDPKVIPSIAYTDPEVAWAGLTEKKRKSKASNTKQQYSRGPLQVVLSHKVLQTVSPSCCLIKQPYYRWCYRWF